MTTTDRFDGMRRFILPEPNEAAGRAMNRIVGVLALVRAVRDPYIGMLKQPEFARLHGVAQQQVSAWVCDGLLGNAVLKDRGRVWIAYDAPRPALVRRSRSLTAPAFELRLPTLEDFCVRGLDGNYRVFDTMTAAKAYLHTLGSCAPVARQPGTLTPWDDPATLKITIPSFTTLAHDGIQQVFSPLPDSDEERMARIDASQQWLAHSALRNTQDTP